MSSFSWRRSRAALGIGLAIERCMYIGQRSIGPDQPPFVIAEIGINHEGSVDKARRMIDDARAAGCECVKFQSHVIDDEYVPAAGKVIPGNAKESILEIMKRCAFDEAQERELKAYAESRGLIYLSTPFSRAAANRLERMGVSAYKIGSGECNNTPLVDHIASFGKPVLVSTGMNDLASIARTVEILDRRGVQYGLFHCTSMYPTPYDKVRLGALTQLAARFPRAVLGLSDHSLGIYTCLAAIPLGARLLEKHFTSDPTWPGPDVPISITPDELRQLVDGARAVFQALGGTKDILPEEQPTIDFAYASVVTTHPVRAGERFTRDNLWVKRPGTGEIHAARYEEVLGRVASRDVAENALLAWSDVGG
jgi:sialic acid synthase SpsE